MPETPRQTFEEQRNDWEGFEAGVKADYARGRTDAFFRGEAEELLSWEGIEIHLDPKSPSWRPLARALQEAVIRASKGVRERDEGEVVPTPPVVPLGAPRGVPASTYPRFSDAVEKFLEEGSRGGWTEKTRRDYAAWLRDFADAAGDRPIDQYTKADGRAFKVILSKLPANRSKKKPLAGLSVGQAAEKGAELGMPPMSLENANKAMGRISTFWKWADSNFFDEPGPAPLAGMAFKLQDALQDKRDPFTSQQLRAIFTAPIYTGFMSPRGWRHPGPMLDVEWSRFWLPLIGLFTGAREGEIFALTVDDVVEESGVPMFRLRLNPEQGTRVKSRSGLRSVPVHSKLIELGFLRLVEKRRSEGHQTLFHDCQHKTEVPVVS